MFREQVRRNDGITIIEMMVVVAIVGLLAALGMPQLYEFVIRTRIETAANEFVASLNLARSEAIRRGRTVVVKSVAGGQDWASKGWTLYVFDDANGNGSQDIGEAVSEVIRMGNPLDKPMTLRSTRNIETFAFAPSGRTPDLYRFLLCYDDQIAKQTPAGSFLPRSWAVTVSTSGRIRLTTPDVVSGDLKMEAINQAGEQTLTASDCSSLA